MSKRLNIGVYIGPDDLDIAAWFNLLRDNDLSRAKWIKGLLAAYSLDKSLDIGTISFASLSENNTAAENDKFGYGWQVKGQNGEFVQGSVVNISIGKSEVVPILEEAWTNNRHLATFIKALIRKNLKVGEKVVLPKPGHLKKMYAEFLVKENSKPLHTDKSVEQPTDPAVSTPTPTSEPSTIVATEPTNVTPEVSTSPKTHTIPDPAPPPVKTPVKQSTPAFNFGGKQETRTKNPLSNYI